MSASITPDSVHTTSLERSDSALEKREQWNLIADRCVKIGVGFFVLANGLAFLGDVIEPRRNIYTQGKPILKIDWVNVNTISAGAFAGHLACAVFAAYAWIQTARS